MKSIGQLIIHEYKNRLYRHNLLDEHVPRGWNSLLAFDQLNALLN